MNTKSTLRAVVCAAVVFGVPVSSVFAADAAPATMTSTPMLIAADDTRGEGTTRSAQTTAKDAAITAKVKAKLLADDDIKGMKIDVDTYNGVVMMSGTVESEAQMAKAAALAAEVKGVSSVTNKLTLSLADVTGKVGAVVGGNNASRSTETTARDAEITAKVKAKLLADPDVSGMKIDVDTRNGVVLLTGTSGSQAQRQRALELAARVDGVVSVTNELTVPGASLGLGAAAGTAESSRSAGTAMKDATISTSVKTKLLADPDIAGMKIDVDVRNKVVSLTGTVASQAQIAQAERLAAGVDGVAAVSNQLKVAK